MHIPHGTVHAIKNGSAPAKLLATFTPAGPEQVFLKIGEPADAQLPDPWTAE
ncbi:MAG: hypothetical protein R3C14_41840 [Caldilineaceae bacterium]